MGFVDDIYKDDVTDPSLTDRYHLATGYPYWLEGRADNPSVSYIFGRKNAEGGGYTVSGGLEGYIDVIKRWQKSGVSERTLAALRADGFPEGYIDYIRKAKWLTKIYAIPEGELFFPQESLILLDGPSKAQQKIMESVGLCIENGQSGYLTRGARTNSVLQADVESGAPKGIASVQGLRRGPAIGAALESSRGLVAGGYKSTSTGTAAFLQGIKFAGTMDHFWVQSHTYQLNHEPGAPTMKDLFKMRDEGRTEKLQLALSKDAFRSYAFAYPINGIFLPDTYDTIVGIEDAITVIKELRALGLGQNYGCVRFDSGDIVEFSKHALRRLAERNDGDLLDAIPPGTDVSKLMHKELLAYAEKSTNAPHCAASDTITAYNAQDMRRAGAYIRFWGIGTDGSHVPPVGLVQKLSLYYAKPLNGKPVPPDEKMTPTMKIVSAAPEKSSNPGRIKSKRYYDEAGIMSHVVIYDEDLGMDPANQIVNIRDFSDTIANPTGFTEKSPQVLVFDSEYRYVYQEPPKKPAYPGSAHMVTDLAAIAENIEKNIATLPEPVRRIERPRDEVLKKLLVKAFEASRDLGQEKLELDIASIENQLPVKQAQIPVYFDALLYAQRVACEQQHVHKAVLTGVNVYVERFEK